MEAIVSIILSYVSIWAPSLVAVFGVVATVLVAISKTKAAIKEYTNSTEIAELRAEIHRLASSNEELNRTNKILVDEMAKIKDYTGE